jgi:hypothetical protein
MVIVKQMGLYMVAERVHTEYVGFTYVWVCYNIVYIISYVIGNIIHVLRQWVY